MAARAQTRDHKDVLAILHVWWQAALRSLHGGNDTSKSEVGKARYVAMMGKIYKTMMEEYDEEEAVQCAEEDWEMDRQGRDALDRTRFCDAIFQLADMCVAAHSSRPTQPMPGASS